MGKILLQTVRKIFWTIKLQYKMQKKYCENSISLLIYCKKNEIISLCYDVNDHIYSKSKSV